jgi:hypothetical protein
MGARTASTRALPILTARKNTSSVSGVQRATASLEMPMDPYAPPITSLAIPGVEDVHCVGVEATFRGL